MVTSLRRAMTRLSLLLHENAGPDGLRNSPRRMRSHREATRRRSPLFRRNAGLDGLRNRLWRTGTHREATTRLGLLPRPSVGADDPRKASATIIHRRLTTMTLRLHQSAVLDGRRKEHRPL
ncbi:hypothetical protein BDZ89DRAFT_719511 [Hymenopellis radicata]|nr:hypothetical protein BDZ89DRAFT_719511 [Hymenopellis radicata]